MLSTARESITPKVISLSIISTNFNKNLQVKNSIIIHTLHNMQEVSKFKKLISVIP